MALTQEPVPLRVYYHSLLDAIRQCPLAASAMLQRQLQVDQHWLGLLRALDGHLGNSKGSVTDCPLAWAGYHDPMDISPPLSPTGGSDIGLEAESGADSEADSMDLSPIE